MLRDGEYATWFRTSHGEGTGIVRLESGKITGGDSFFSYSGVYEVDGDRFTATLRTRRRADGPTTLLGVDEVELKLEGSLNRTLACCSGACAQAPGVHFEATLFLGPEEAAPPELPRRVSDCNIARLPKAQSERYRARNLLGPGSSR